MKLKEYHYLFMIGFIIVVLGLIETRVKLFILFGSLILAIGFGMWVIDDIEKKAKRNKNVGK